MCGCGGVTGVVTKSKINTQEVSKACGGINNELLGLYNRTRMVLNKVSTTLMEETKVQILSWMGNLKVTCPDENDYNIIKQLVESEYSKYYT